MFKAREHAGIVNWYAFSLAGGQPTSYSSSYPRSSETSCSITPEKYDKMIYGGAYLHSLSWSCDIRSAFISNPPVEGFSDSESLFAKVRNEP